MPKCPKCDKPGQQFPYLACGHGACTRGTTRCHVCDGTNEVSDQKLADLDRGERSRQVRLESHQSIRERAKDLGIPPSVLSWLEIGHVPDEHRETAERIYRKVLG